MLNSSSVIEKRGLNNTSKGHGEQYQYRFCQPLMISVQGFAFRG
jgi:hypothetical protein